MTWTVLGKLAHFLLDGRLTPQDERPGHHNTQITLDCAEIEKIDSTLTTNANLSADELFLVLSTGGKEGANGASPSGPESNLVIRGSNGAAASASQSQTPADSETPTRPHGSWADDVEDSEPAPKRGCVGALRRPAPVQPSPPSNTTGPSTKMAAVKATQVTAADFEMRSCPEKSTIFHLPHGLSFDANIAPYRTQIQYTYGVWLCPVKDRDDMLVMAKYNHRHHPEINKVADETLSMDNFLRVQEYMLLYFRLVEQTSTTPDLSLFLHLQLIRELDERAARCKEMDRYIRKNQGSHNRRSDQKDAPAASAESPYFSASKDDANPAKRKR